MDKTIQARRRPRLLLVEDDAAMRDVLTRQLDARGCVVTAVDAAEEGIVEAGETAFDAVVADIHLPGRSGIDLAGYLLTQDPGLPVILITADPDEDLAREALSTGPVSYLVKPFENFELESVVQQALARRGWKAEAGGRLVNETAAGGAPDVPAEWIEFLEIESFAGPGHGERVARIAQLLCAEIPRDNHGMTVEELALAARIHEVGRLGSPDVELPAMAAASAELMTEAGFPRPAVRAVRHLYEHWDGTGGPVGLSGSNIPMGARVLAVSDSLDHYTAAWVQSGLNRDNAIDRAIHLVTVQQGRVFDSGVVGGLHRRIDDVRRAITGWHEADSTETVTTASFSSNLADMPFKVA